MEIPSTGAAQPWHTTRTQCQHFTGLGPSADRHRLLAIEGLEFHRCAQGRRRHRHLHAAVQVVTASFEDRMGLLDDLDIQITGFPTTLPGEVALNGFGARQLRQPGPVLLLAADLLSRAHLNDTTPDLADAVSFGLRLGGVCAPVLAQRWEEGWERPLSEWRDQLGISEELRLSPFAVSPAVD